MELKDRIEKIKPYLVTFNIIAGEGAAYAVVKFPNRWTISDQQVLKETYKVEIATQPEGVYFISEIKNGTDCIFDAIEFVICLNKSVEERESLLKEKVTELTELFATESLDSLKKLKFVLPNKKKSSIKSLNQKKDENKPLVTEEVDASQANVNDVTVENNNDNDLMSLAKEIVE